jgi:hypothetical protein
MPFNSRILPTEMGFKEETLAESMARYSGFGKDLFFELESHFPGMISKLRFFQPQDSQSDDIWAVYNDGTIQFGIQLEPNTPVIVLWNNEPGNSIELGTWWENEYEAAIAFIEEVFFGKEPNGKFSFD